MKTPLLLFTATLASLCLGQPADSAAVVNISAVVGAMMELSVNQGPAGASADDHVVLTSEFSSKTSALNIRTNLMQWKITAQAEAAGGDDLSAISLELSQTDPSIVEEQGFESHNLDRFRHPVTILRGRQPAPQNGTNAYITYELAHPVSSSVSAVIHYRILPSL